MTNKELRDKGELYDANYDPELVRLMDECKDKCWEYNQIKPSDWIAKDAKLREIIGSVGSGVRVQAPFWCDYGHLSNRCGLPLDASRASESSSQDNVRRGL